MHKRLVKWGEEVQLHFLTNAELKIIREHAAAFLPWYDLSMHDGFTLIGKNADDMLSGVVKKIIAAREQKILDSPWTIYEDT